MCCLYPGNITSTGRMSGKSQAILQFEQQVEMMDTVFMR